jgi:hypothetical protein
VAVAARVTWRFFGRENPSFISPIRPSPRSQPQISTLGNSPCGYADTGATWKRGRSAGCATSFYPSEWAKRSAVVDYGVRHRIIHVIPFGPNLDRELVDRFCTVKRADFENSLRILYVSVDWRRKNGDLVLKIGRGLRRVGVPCQLFLVGQIPVTVQAEDGVNVIGFLDKTKPADLNG